MKLMPQTDLASWPQHYMAKFPPRSKSVVMTVFGDAVVPHGGALWLGSLIRLLAPFGMSDRLVRTSVYRLAEEGWLSAQRKGRRSLYTLRPEARSRFLKAHQRVYTPTYLTWDQCWTQVLTLPHSLDAAERAQLRKELAWEGFGALSPTAFIHPNPDTGTLNDMLRRLGVADRLFIARIQPARTPQGRPWSDLIAECWDLDSVAQDYERFLEWFGPLTALVREQPELDNELAFVLRSLLIHEFRRVQLHDPQLPLELLPARWAGKKAYDLCRELYRALHRPSQAYVLDVLRLEDEHAPEADETFFERFGGLTQAGTPSEQTDRHV